MSGSPEVSVIIPHYRDLKGLDLCLKALEAQTFPRDRFEIVVADNNSPEGEAAVAAAIHGRARLVVVTEKGAGPARNGAVAASAGAILAFTDSDCVPEPQWIEAGLEGLKRFDIVGGQVTVLLADPPRMTPEEAFERVFAFDFKTYIEKKGFTGAGNMFCARTLFDQVGGFRPAVSEDLEWSQRATGKGFSLGYAPEARVGHPARRTWAELEGKWRRLNAETWALWGDRRGRTLRWIVKALALPLSAVAHTPKVFASRNLSTFGQRLAALAVLYRLRFWRCGHSFALLLQSGKG